jgi:hypothetical protein
MVTAMRVGRQREQRRQGDGDSNKGDGRANSDGNKEGNGNGDNGGGQGRGIVSGGKITIFQIGHMTKVSTQIYSSIPQYDVYEVSLKKIEWKVPFGWVKVDIFATWAQQVGWLLGFGGF